MITIKDKQAIAKSDGAEYAMPLVDLVGNIRGQRDALIYPDGLKLLKYNQQGNFAVAIYEIPPAVHSIRWIADDSPSQYGPGTTYITRQLAMPYIILSLPVSIGSGLVQLYPSNCECFFRNEPVSSVEDELFYPALLNVSKMRAASQSLLPLAWLCTQYIDLRPVQKARTMNEKLWKIIHQARRCLLQSGFNYSSEQNEGNSHYSDYISGVNANSNIKDIKKWEKASIKDPLFVLKIPWKRTGETINSLTERTMKLIGAGNGEVNAGQLESIIFNKGTAV